MPLAKRFGEHHVASQTIAIGGRAAKRMVAATTDDKGHPVFRYRFDLAVREIEEATIAIDRFTLE